MANELLEHLYGFVEENKKDEGHCSFCIGFNEGMEAIVSDLQHYLKEE